jgi:streptogramin lyase
MMMRQSRYWDGWKILTVAACTLPAVLAGCSAGLAPGSQSAPVTAVQPRLSGKVFGGQQPIFGAVIQLYAVGTTGVKSASTPLIATTVTSAQDGSFNITGDWNCTSNTAVYGTNPLLYMTATGGNPGLASVTNNTGIVLMAALGPCSGVTASTSVQLNELTTVAAAYALAPFALDATDIGAQGVNPVGLVNAFNTAGMLVSFATGAAPGSVPANGTVPVAELNTLANIAAACVNSAGTTGACPMLFSATAPAVGSMPANIFTALLNVAANPANQVATLLGISGTQPPFAPSFSTAPNDWSVALKYTGGGLSWPAGIAVDASGDVWVANASGSSVTEISPSGVLLTGAAGYGSGLYGVQAVAVDKTGNVWLADTLLSSAVKLSVSGGAVQSSASFTGGGISGPTSLAIDSQNNVWLSNFAGGTVTELSSQGTPIGSALTASGQMQAPIGISIDGSGNAWVADNALGSLFEFDRNQALVSTSGYTDNAMVAPVAIAFDASTHAWTVDNGNSGVSLFAAGGRSILTAPVTGGGLSMPSAVAVDGAGKVWVTNAATAGSLSELAYGQSAPVTASGLGVLNTPMALAIDASGSIWTANAGDNSVSEFVGMATPVTTPLAANAGP